MEHSSLSNCLTHVIMLSRHLNDDDGGGDVCSRWSDGPCKRTIGRMSECYNVQVKDDHFWTLGKGKISSMMAIFEEAGVWKALWKMEEQRRVDQEPGKECQEWTTSLKPRWLDWEEFSLLCHQCAADIRYFTIMTWWDPVCYKESHGWSMCFKFGCMGEC